MKRKKILIIGGGGTRKDALKTTYVDDKRRFDQFSELIRDKEYLDFGTGLGGALDMFKSVAKSVHGVELQEEILQYLKDNQNYSMFCSIDEVPEELKFDVVTLFHVFEHLSTPLNYLKKIRNSLKVSGKIIIEVPHANDVLISLFEIEEFKKFTFFSEHLILHTRNSIEVYLKKAGFRNIIIQGFQRYPLANHLYWLSQKKPRGHVEMAYFQSKDLNNAYSDMLNSLDKTDTLIAIAEK